MEDAVTQVGADVAADVAQTSASTSESGGDEGDRQTTRSQDAPAVGQSAAISDELSGGRHEMLDLIAKWMPTSLNSPMIPDGETEDLMAKAGWTKATGQASKAVKDSGGHPATSCGDILRALLVLWRSNFVGSFLIRDCDSTGHPPGAKELGYYVEADGTSSPRPGDVLVLRNGIGKASAGSVGHVGILVEDTEDTWRTADGGGGALPDQTAGVTIRAVRYDESGIAILKSPTDGKEKQLDGWIDLERLEQVS